jgi:Zn-dependent protease
MFSILSTIGPEIPFTLLLLALMGLRHTVTPQASLVISAPLEKVFAVIDVHDGKTDHWGTTTVAADLVDPATQTFRKTYTTTLSTGVRKVSQALFRIAAREAPTRLVLVREGLQGRSTNSELLEQRFELAAEGEATRLTMTYVWGSRPLLAQVMARADLWGGIHRLKGVAETGQPNEKPYMWISAAVALLTGLVSLVAFGVLLGWLAAVVLVFALFVHEFGHLLAYRLMGQPWGRMVFLPFLGAIALPRLAFDSQAQSVFAALMGPGFSTVLALVCLVPAMLGETPNGYVAILGLITVGLNIFNLLPVEPLDGGVALRSVLSRLMGRWARFGLMAVGVIIMVAGVILQHVVLLIFGGLAVLANIRQRTIDAGLEPLTRFQIIVTVFAYVAMTSAYITLLRYFLGYASLLNPAG